MKQLTILYADDDQDDLDFFREIINGFEKAIICITVTDGLQALDTLHSVTTDIIFLDLNMPQLNGIECLKKIMNDDALRGIPVIMHSTSDLNRAQCLEVGATAFIVKANDFSTMRQNIQAVLKKYW